MSTLAEKLFNDLPRPDDGNAYFREITVEGVQRIIDAARGLQEDPDGWIIHHGQGAPDLAPRTVVEMEFRDGDILTLPWDTYHADCPEDSNWCHEPCPLDIIAYRVVTP